MNAGPGKFKWSTRTVNRVMQMLQDRGEIEVEQRGPTSSLYHPKKQQDAPKFGVPSEEPKKVEENAETPKSGVPFGVPFGVPSDAHLLLSENPLSEEELEKRQHHRLFESVKGENADDAALSPAYASAVEADFGRKLSRDDVAFCLDLKRRGIDAATVCAGVVVGRARKLCSDKNRGITDPIRSLRYFANCIEEAASGEFPASYVEHARSWLRRRTEASADTHHQVPTPVKAPVSKPKRPCRNCHGSGMRFPNRSYSCTEQEICGCLAGARLREEIEALLSGDERDIEKLVRKNPARAEQIERYLANAGGST